MSIFTTIASGLSKAENFLINIFTKGSAIAAAISKLSPAVLAAMLATFYDVVKAAQAATAAATSAAAGDIPVAFTMSQTTLALIKQVVTDGENDASLIAADLKALGIAASTPAVAPTVS